MGRLIIGGVILIATTGLVAYAPMGQMWLKLVAMLVGLVAGVCFLRFAPPWPWANPLVLVLFIGVWFALGGVPGIGWFGGFIAGANFGAAWHGYSREFQPDRDLRTGETLPIHVRANIVTRKRPSLIFGGAYYSYDVRFQDGTVQQDVNLNAVLQGARYPADYHTVQDGAEAVAGDGVPGEWVDYPYGRPLRD